MSFYSKPPSKKVLLPTQKDDINKFLSFVLHSDKNKICIDSIIDEDIKIPSYSLFLDNRKPTVLEIKNGAKLLYNHHPNKNVHNYSWNNDGKTLIRIN